MTNEKRCELSNLRLSYGGSAFLPACRELPCLAFTSYELRSYDRRGLVVLAGPAVDGCPYEELGLLYLAQHFAPTFYGVGPS